MARPLRTLAAALVLALPALAAVQADAKPRDCSRTAGGVDLQRATVLDLQRAMASHRLTSVALTRAYLARIAAYDHGPGHLNAVRLVNPHAVDEALARDAERRHGTVRGPLHGVPVLLKDNVGTHDLPTTAGSIALAGALPKKDADITARLRAAGAVILGKTNLSEFANWVDLSMPNGYSSLGGQVVNAYTGGDPSGSSSGSGVAASMAFAAVTIGTETSGSILSPSDANSAVGVKPTLGLASTAGIIPLAPSFDVPGPITRNVTDAAAVLAAIATKPDGYLAALRPGALKGVRLGVPSADNRPSGTRGQVFDRALADLRRAGATLVETDLLGNAGIPSLAEIGLIPNEFKWSLDDYLATATRTSTGVKTLADVIAYNAKHPDKVKYGQNLLQASDATPGNGVLATAGAAPVRAQAQAAIDGALAADGLDAIVDLGPANANVGAAAGYPTVIVPAGYTGDTPVGLAFTGTARAERALLSYAFAYEQASHRRVPPTDLDPTLAPARC
ncbi:MAG TPA: amidase family protein [Mycobacteriales bacterium]|jgi:amidase|nr:amidase family protein [Mycobacteriales bacterium]